MPSKLPDQGSPAVQEQSNPAPSPAWILKADGDAQTVQAMAVHLGCLPAIAQVLVARGIDTPAAAEAFLNPTLDALLDDANQSQDMARRRADYLEAQQILARDLPAINLWYLDAVLVHTRRLGHIKISSSGNFDFLRTATVTDSGLR